MASLVKKFHENYHYVMEEQTDPRTRGLPLANPGFLLTVTAAYLVFCCNWGPKIMRDRKPFDLTKILIVYNFLQVLLSIYIVYVGLSIWLTSYNFTCQPVDPEINPVTIAMHKLAWWYYFGKITELLDTVFFVLRKKNNQITFLHIYHHFSMPLLSYFGMRYYPNGHGTLFGILNSFVHIVMYTYYLVAGLGPKYQKYLWWKKHVTIIQLIQFAFIFIHNFNALVSSCTYPKYLHVMMCTDSVFFFYMFSKFYFRTYLNNNNEKITVNGSTQNGKKKVRMD